MTKSIKDRVMRVLLDRQDRWTLSFHIARLADCHSGPSEPVVRRAIAELISSGVPIISCTCGYKIASSELEVKKAVAKLHSRADEIRDRGSALTDAWTLWKLGEEL